MINCKSKQKIKQIIDFLLGVALLVLTAPLFFVIALAIKLDSKGPVLFKQERIGKNKNKFLCYKFRTMRNNCSDEVHKENIHNLLTLGYSNVQDRIYGHSNDPRITRVGSILRKCSLDELPQLINVIKGQMSLVGPRPAIDYELKYYDKNMFKRFSVMPGITGYWQTGDYPKADYMRMVTEDLYYIDNWSIGLDLNILLKTILVVFRKRNEFAEKGGGNA